MIKIKIIAQTSSGCSSGYQHTVQYQKVLHDTQKICSLRHFPPVNCKRSHYLDPHINYADTLQHPGSLKELNAYEGPHQLKNWHMWFHIVKCNNNDKFWLRLIGFIVQQLKDKDLKLHHRPSWELWHNSVELHFNRLIRQTEIHKFQLKTTYVLEAIYILCVMKSFVLNDIN